MAADTSREDVAPGGARSGPASGAAARREPAVAVLAGCGTATNRRLVEACWRRGIPARLLRPHDAEEHLLPGDIVLARLDVLATVDGIEPGLSVLCRLARGGVRVLNSPAALLAAHDKAATARHLAWHGVPHPRTCLLRPGEALPRVMPPVVLKPRFGTGGRGTFLCRSRSALDERLRQVRHRSWFRRHGAILQQVLPSEGHDLQVLVAGGRVAGAITRITAPGEWRTSVALGAERRPVVPPPQACELALAAAAAVGGQIVGVDLLPLSRGRHVVLEVDVAVEFTEDYALGHQDVFEQMTLPLRMLAARPTFVPGQGVVGLDLPGRSAPHAPIPAVSAAAR